MTDPGVGATERARAGIDRRSLLKKSAIAGTAAWIAPVIASSPAAAAAGSCAGLFLPTVVLPTGGSDTGPFTACTELASGTATICWEPGATVLLSSDSAGTMPPVFDELGIVEVTPPSGGANLVRWVVQYWQPDCATIRGPVSNVVPSPVAPVDITAMFGTESGDFSIYVGAWNAFTPGGWSTIWVVPGP